MNRTHLFYHGRAQARRLCLVLIFASLALLLPDESLPRASASPITFVPSPANKCKTYLIDVELPKRFDTFSGHTNRNHALNWLDQTFGINTAGKLLRYFKTRAEFDKLLAPQFLAPESLAGMALRAELQCILPNVSHNHRDLLDSAMYRSLYKLGKIDPQDDIQITALRHYLEKIAIAKGRPYYDEEQQILDVPSPDDLRHWIGTARQTPPAVRTCEDKKNQPKAENCLVFQDGSTFDFPPPAKDDPPPQIVIPAHCIKLDAQSWDDEGVILNTLSAPSVLRLDVNLVHPPDDPRYDLMVHDPNDNGVLLRRTIRGKHRTSFVFSSVAQAYRLRLKAVPVTAKLCWEEITAQPIGAGETQTTRTVPLTDKEFRYYAYDAVCTDNVNVTLTGNAGDTAYYVRAPLAPGLTPVVSGIISPPGGPVPIPYPAGGTCSSPPNPRRFLIALGHFEDVQDPCAPGNTNPCRTLPSAFQVAPPHASEVKLTLQKTSTLETFYTARISQMTWSNDQEDVLWEGEINSYASAQLVDASNNATALGMDFPYYVYREAEDNDNPFLDLPTINSEFPVLGMRKGDLESNYLGYILSLSSYEDDSAVLHYLNPVTWYTIAAAFYSAVGDGIACVFGGGAKSCYDAVCDLLSAVAELGAFITSVEDDLLGTAAGRFMKANSGDQSVFGLLPGENSRRATVQGSMNPNNNLWMELKRITDAACSGTYAAIKYLMTLAVGAEDQDPWTKADLQIDLLPVRSNIQQIDVQFNRVNVTNDREGFGRGDGDMYLYTTVGTLGDPGSAPGQTGDAATRLSADKLQALPMSTVDVMRLPQSGERGIGDNGSWLPNARIFSNSWANTEFVAGLYVQIVMFDADNFEDDEVGIVSDYYSFDTLWQFVSWCAQGNVAGYVRDFGTNQCKATRTKKVYTREYLKDDGKQGTWGSEGATFTYEIHITPTNWP